MRRRNYYAVRVGKEAGIYSTWSQFQDSIRGVPNAVYKGFDTFEEAKEYLSDGEGGDALVAYTAGVHDRDGRYGWGVAIVQPRADESRARGFCGQGNASEHEDLGRAAGEAEAVLLAMQYALDHGCADLILEYTLPQIREWAMNGATSDSPGIQHFAEETARMMNAGLKVFYKKMNASGWGSRKAMNLARRGLDGEAFGTTGEGVPLPKVIARQQDMTHVPVPPSQARTALERSIARAMMRAAALFDLVDGRDTTEEDSLLNRMIAFVSEEPSLKEPAGSQDLRAEVLRSANTAYEKHVLESGMMEGIVAEGEDQEAKDAAREAVEAAAVELDSYDDAPKEESETTQELEQGAPAPEEEYERIFQKLVRKMRDMRMQRRMSQQAAAETCGLTRSMITKMEQGHYGMRTDTFRRYAEALGAGHVPEIDQIEALEERLPSTFLEMLRY